MTVGVVLLAVTVAILAVLVFRKSPSWPASVATVQGEITTACENPDVASEPNQVNFACNKNTSQILWVFALMTSGNNPSFSDAKSGRQGLEPIAPAQGGEVAWTLNLHHPYNPLTPIDSPCDQQHYRRRDDHGQQWQADRAARAGKQFDQLRQVYRVRSGHHAGRVPRHLCAAGQRRSRPGRAGVRRLSGMAGGLAPGGGPGGRRAL
jgi:hypothetical protein